MGAPRGAPIPADGRLNARRRPPIPLPAVVFVLIAVAPIGMVVTVILLFTGGNPPAGPPNTVGPSRAAPPAPAPTISQPPPVVVAPPLDGTYRLDSTTRKGPSTAGL